jgi:hypothetical protein
MALRIPLIQKNPEKIFQKYLGLVRTFTNFPLAIINNEQLFEDAVFKLSQLYFKDEISDRLKRVADYVTKPIPVDYFIED